MPLDSRRFLKICDFRLKCWMFFFMVNVNSDLYRNVLKKSTLLVTFIFGNIFGN